MSDMLSGVDVCHAVLENAADAILVLENDVIVGCNAKAEELLGCRRGQMIGQPVHRFSPPRQRDQRDSREKALDMVDNALRHGPQRFEWLHTRCDGTEFDAEVALNRVDLGGEVLLAAVVRDITRRKRLEDAIHNIAAGISAATGQEYLNLLVQYVARALDASCAFVGELIAGDRVRTVAISVDGRLSDNVEYKLLGTPCENVLERRMTIYPSGVQQMFPTDTVLADLQAESYIGVPLLDSHWKPLGLLAATRRGPIEDPAFAEYIMRIFSARTSGEMERRKALQELLEEKKLTDTIINCMPGIFYMIDSKGRVIWRNQLLSDLTGGRLGEHDIADPRERILEQDLQVFDQAVAQAMSEGSASVELRFTPHPDKVLVYRCVGARVDIGGESYVVGVGIDVTKTRETEDALRESETNLRAIFENSPIGIYQSTPEGRFLHVNAALARMFGFDSPEEMVSQITDIPEQIFVHPERRAEFVQRVMQSDEFLHLENDYRRRDGSILDADLYMGVQRPDDRPAYLMGFVEDITDRKRAEQDKQRFYRETIFSVTDGKLTICDPAHVQAFTADAAVTVEIRTAADLSQARKAIRQYCISNDLEGARLDLFMEGVGEATTNVVKHADGGTTSAGRTDGSIWVSISDTGPGIEHITLPRALLLRGFSTKSSLGIGYTVMLDVADRILLCTSKDGTTVILTKTIAEGPSYGPLTRILERQEEGHLQG